MIIKKHITIKYLAVLWLVGFALSLITPVNLTNAQSVPDGCPGSANPGPAFAGTVCPDGSTPVKDPTLPYGCPGSSAMGPVASNYTTVCPARPGRAQCTYSVSTGQCTQSTTTGSSEECAEEDSKNCLKTDCKDTNLSTENCGIIKWLLTFINTLSAIVGVVIVIVIIIGGIQYSTSGGNPQGTQAAKKRIGNAIAALLLYIFGFALLQWIIPGGLF